MERLRQEHRLSARSLDGLGKTEESICAAVSPDGAPPADEKTGRPLRPLAPMARAPTVRGLAHAPLPGHVAEMTPQHREGFLVDGIVPHARLREVVIARAREHLADEADRTQPRDAP